LCGIRWARDCGRGGQESLEADPACHVLLDGHRHYCLRAHGGSTVADATVLSAEHGLGLLGSFYEGGRASMVLHRARRGRPARHHDVSARLSLLPAPCSLRHGRGRTHLRLVGEGQLVDK
ncbi:hypothetical protein PENTCL1PPCAC_5246, partial [Pristionchus entomophagus]